MMWFLWSCFWAVEILFDGGSQAYVTYDPPWHFTNISPGKALAFSVMEKKKKSRKQWKANSHISRGDVGGGAESTSAPQVFVIRLSMHFLGSPLHNSSSSSRLAAELPALQVTNLHKRHPLRLSAVKSHREEKWEPSANSSASSSKHHGTAQRIMRTS